ncbi:MAG: TAXI family TRAP transporter solute-binding subunit [Bacillota bacterium]
MRKKQIGIIMTSSILILTLLLVFAAAGCGPTEPVDPDEPAAPEPPTGERISVRWNTADVGSYGYSVASLMVELLNRELPNKLEGNYTVTIHPFPATGAGMKAAMEGDGDIAYTADVGMTQVYAEEAAYSLEEWPGRANADLLVHSFYAYPMETSLAVHRDNAANFQGWSDFDGEPVFFTPAGFMNWLNMGRIFRALDIEFNHTEIDSGMVADALRDGSIVGAAIYTTAGRSLPTYLREAEMRLAGELVAVSPTADEVAMLEAAGLAVLEIDATVPFSTDVGTDSYKAVPILFAYNVMAHTPAEFVKAKLEIFYENAAQLAEWEPGFGPLANDFIGMQVSGIRANPDIPVHPGMAEFLQDHGAWDDSWIIAEQ